MTRDKIIIGYFVNRQPTISWIFATGFWNDDAFWVYDKRIIDLNNVLSTGNWSDGNFWNDNSLWTS